MLYSTGPIIIVGRKGLSPGETACVRIYPLLTQEWQDVRVGSRLSLMRASTVAGTAVVTEVFDIPPYSRAVAPSLSG